eukprot:scaffold1147_cov125-Isochrysis_galbana.AAC.8
MLRRPPDHRGWRGGRLWLPAGATTSARASSQPAQWRLARGRTDRQPGQTRRRDNRRRSRTLPTRISALARPGTPPQPTRPPEQRVHARRAACHHCAVEHGA